MNEDEHTIASGYLDVGDGHEIYYQTWGNPEGAPVFVLHGGPGLQSKDKHKSDFDPEKHFVVFHDQRGSGQSKAKNILINNTTNDLVHDIEELRKKLKYEKINIFGLSWGSTLALYYAINHPDKVTKLIIGGVYTATASENSHIYQGGLAHTFPEAWERFIEIVPEDHKNNTLKYYYNVFSNGTDQEKLLHLKHWSQLEPSPMSIDSDYINIRYEADNIKDLSRLNSTLIGIHYFIHNCFIEDSFIYDNLHKIKGIPTVIVQGRFDQVCLPITAYRVAQKIGSSCRLHFVPGAHAREMAIRETLRAYAWAFFD